MHVQALQPSRNFCETQEIRPFSRSHCINLEITEISRNFKKMPFFGGNYSLGAPCMCAHYFHLCSMLQNLFDNA